MNPIMNHKLIDVMHASLHADVADNADSDKFTENTRTATQQAAAAEGAPQ